ncbi:ATP-binding cassette domain-containing protein, partial [Streptomyces sp. BE20]|uniref:ATP-binding cassette domain-containing protein n=1 Tax=Streptomyces sp. BE20 TaxID=3002525 RepID=UPI002E7AA586
CRTINRLETIDSGTISIDGRPLPPQGPELSRQRAQVGKVLQSINQLAHKTERENQVNGQVKVRGNAPDLLERVGVPPQAQNFPAQQSRGQQQRGAIAPALAFKPNVILFE